MEEKIIIEPPCFRCRYLLLYPFCAAFQGEIPDEIRQGKNDHKEPYPGDNGIQFELVETAQEGAQDGTTD